MAGCQGSHASDPEDDPRAPRPTILYMVEDDVWEAEYDVIDDHVVVDDDIALGPVAEAWSEHAEIAAMLASSGAPKSTMDARRRRTWEGGVIPYDFSGDDAWDEGRFERRQIEAAVETWNSLSQITGVRWERAELAPRDSGVRFDYVSSERCDSEIGRKQRRYDINLAPACVYTLAPILHEMGHAAGLVHEHQRSDRDEYVRYSTENHKGRRRDTRVIEHLPRRAQEIGGYDTESIMHYASLPARDRMPEPFPSFSNRHVLTAWGTATGSVGVLDRFRARYNRFVRWDGHGVRDPREDFRVIDVDGDGFDDLVAALPPGLVWSSKGASGWRPLAPGGQTLDAALDEVSIGDFDDAKGRDVLRVRGQDWTLFSSDGSSSSVVRTEGARDVEVGDITGDGRDDVFVVNDDGSWAYTVFGEVLGPMTPRAPADMGVDEVRLVSLDGEGVDVLAFLDGVLSYCPEGSTRLRPLFSGDGRGPLPEHVRSLDALWFGHVDDARSDESARVDLVTWSSGDDPTGVGEGSPVFVSDVGVAADPTLRPFAEGPVLVPIWVDLRHAALGYFLDDERVSFLSFGYIPWNAHIAESDIRAIATHYLGSGHATLTDKYPLPSSGDVRQIETITVAPNEQIELEADFMAPSTIRTVVSSRERLTEDDTWALVDSYAQSFASDAVVVRDVFFAEEGTWRVRVFPSDPGETTLHDIAEWRFRVVGVKDR